MLFREVFGTFYRMSVLYQKSLIDTLVQEANFYSDFSQLAVY